MPGFWGGSYLRGAFSTAKAFGQLSRVGEHRAAGQMLTETANRMMEWGVGAGPGGNSLGRMAGRLGAVAGMGYVGYKTAFDPRSTTGKIGRFGLAAGAVLGGGYAAYRYGPLAWTSMAGRFSKKAVASTVAREVTNPSMATAASVASTTTAGSIVAPIDTVMGARGARLLKLRSGLYSQGYRPLQGTRIPFTPIPGWGRSRMNYGKGWAGRYLRRSGLDAFNQASRYNSRTAFHLPNFATGSIR